MSDDAPQTSLSHVTPAKIAKVAKDPPSDASTFANFAKFAGAKNESDISRPPASDWRAAVAAIAAASQPRPDPLAGVPREWVEGVRRLEAASRWPWQDTIRDARRLLKQDAAKAFRQGWTAVDLFGCHPKAPDTRFDAMGLALVLRGGTIEAWHDDHAIVRMRHGTLTYTRRHNPVAVPLWEIL